MSLSPKLPSPHPDVAGRNTTERKPDESFAVIAKRYQPKGVEAETTVATVSRFSDRLIDRKTGRAYSADEIAPSNASVNAAIAQDPAATRAAIGMASTTSAPINETALRIPVYDITLPPEDVTVSILVSWDAYSFSAEVTIFEGDNTQSGYLLEVLVSVINSIATAEAYPFVATDDGTNIILSWTTSAKPSNLTVTTSQLDAGSVIPCNSAGAAATAPDFSGEIRYSDTLGKAWLATSVYPYKWIVFA